MVAYTESCENLAGGLHVCVSRELPKYRIKLINESNFSVV